MLDPEESLLPDLTVIQIDYEPGTPDPGRVFRSMAALIEAFHDLDRDLARAVAVSVEPELLLERVEAGSIRAVLRTVLRQIDDDSLKNLDWKPLIGQYLVAGKHRLLKWLDGRHTIQTRAEVVDLQRELVALAPHSVQDRLLPPADVPLDRLLADIERISAGVAELRAQDSAYYVSATEATRVETGIRFTSDEIELLLTQETATSDAELVLLVKKPDYLGQSRWEFKLDEHPIEAKMLDDAWLNRFRSGDVVLRPGDALKALVRTQISRGFEGNVVAIRYEVLQVRQIISGGSEEQELLFGPQ